MGRHTKYHDITLSCVVCGTEFVVPENKLKKTCSRDCYKKSLLGSSNPNYGNKWTATQVMEQSAKIKTLYENDETYRYRVGASNRGKTFSQDRIDAMHKHRDKSSYSHPHSVLSKKTIGEKSAKKWTDEYKNRMYIQGVEAGRIISDDLREDFAIYQKESHWIKGMWGIAEGSEKVSIDGVFNCKTNRNGRVRDHKLSKTDGFKIGLFPEILRHPANCQILTHSENSSKREKSSIGVQILLDNIKIYAILWEEHELVLELITRWESGERFSAQTYRRKSQCQMFT